MKEKGSISVPPKKVRLPRSPHFVGIGAWWGVQAIYGCAILASITQINGVTPIKKSSNKYLPWFFSRGSCSCVVCWISWKIPESYFSKSWDWDIQKSSWSMFFLLNELIIRWRQAILSLGFLCRTHRVLTYPWYFLLLLLLLGPVSDFYSKSLIYHIQASGSPQPIHFLKAHDVS